MFPQILLVLENISLSAKLRLLEESSQSPEQSQHNLDMVNFFITETTSMIQNGLILEVHDKFVNNLNYIIESEGAELEDDSWSTTGRVLGSGALMATGAGILSKYKPAKDLITKNYNNFQQSDANQSFKEFSQDAKKAYNFTKDKFNQHIKPSYINQVNMPSNHPGTPVRKINPSLTQSFKDAGQEFSQDAKKAYNFTKDKFNQHIRPKFNIRAK